ncbi:DUF1330 domain-containing protein [Paenalcaligenes niemegkensis]|uniref:DUF1330 domain-containing protein n=1 Tax=Paenalcaligenes niemegkensis TaxID=2895469 RepID=UPI001EE84A8B|nr:DUF1330 domain-containing protein [Paenalcaligenes niemegkensis]MCQ9616859.1 DUF1330 domain-containing protein [Paenalcaligenes niemegkensis]
MASYLIANVVVTNPEQYKLYQQLSSHAMQTHGVRVLARGGETRPLEGDAPTRTVIMEFDSLDAAEAFHASPEYVAARQARDGAADMTMYVVQGL